MKTRVYRLVVFRGFIIKIPNGTYVLKIMVFTEIRKVHPAMYVGNVWKDRFKFYAKIFMLFKNFMNDKM